MVPRPRWHAAAALAAAALLVSCGGGASEAPPATAAATIGSAPTVTVWFSDDAGSLRPERRPGVGGRDLLAQALAALAAGPSAPDLIPALPPGTTVLGSRVEDGVAVVDLSREFEAGYPRGGSAAELAAVAPLVRTASAAAGTRRALILVEGRAPAPTGAQLDLSVPRSPGELAPGR